MTSLSLQGSKKASEIEQERFDNDDTLKELQEAEVLSCSPKPWKTFDPRSFNWSFSIITQKNVLHFANRYCDNIDIRLVFSSFKIVLV